jgi:hypothetical protein
MRHKLKRIVLSAFFFVIFLFVASIAFIVFYKLPVQQTKEQIEYRELYKKLFKDDILTEDEIKQLDKAFAIAYPG